MRRHLSFLSVIGLLLVILAGPCKSLHARSLVQGPLGRTYHVVEFEASNGLTFAPRLAVRSDESSRHSILVEAYDPSTDSTSTLLPPGVNIDGLDDRSPGLEVDPFDGSLYLIWTRKESDDSDILLARYDGEAWGEPIALTNDRADNRDPSFIQDATGRIHIVWWEATQEPTLRYASFYPQDPWLSGALTYSSVDVLARIGCESGLCTPSDSLGSRFPFLAYDSRTDQIYLAYESSVDGSISVIRFSATNALDNPTGGGQPIVPIKISLRLSKAEGMNSSLPTVFTYRDIVVVFWLDSESTVGYVFFNSSGNGAAIGDLEVPVGSTRELVQTLVTQQVMRLISGKQNRYPTQQTPALDMRPPR